MGCSQSRKSQRAHIPFDIISISLSKNYAIMQILEKLSSEDFSSFINSAETVELKKGEMLVSEGDLAEELFVVAEGSIGLLDGGTCVETVGRGGFTGEDAFLYGTPHRLSLAALLPSVVYRLSRVKLEKIALAVERYYESLPLLQKLSHDDKQYLFEYSKIVQFVKGENVVLRGEKAHQFYFLLQGDVFIDSKRLAEGDHFGEDAMLEADGKYPCTVIVKSSAKLLALNSAGFNSTHFVAVRTALQAEVEERNIAKKSSASTSSSTDASIEETLANFSLSSVAMSMASFTGLSTTGFVMTTTSQTDSTNVPPQVDITNMTGQNRSSSQGKAVRKKDHQEEAVAKLSSLSVRVDEVDFAANGNPRRETASRTLSRTSSFNSASSLHREEERQRKRPSAPSSRASSTSSVSGGGRAQDRVGRVKPGAGSKGSKRSSRISSKASSIEDATEKNYFKETDSALAFDDFEAVGLKTNGRKTSVEIAGVPLEPGQGRVFLGSLVDGMMVFDPSNASDLFSVSSWQAAASSASFGLFSVSRDEESYESKRDKKLNELIVDFATVE